MRNLAILNELWDGKSQSFDRRKEGSSFTVKGARLTVALQVQGATLRSFFDRSDGLARGIGFLARFLIAWPESTQGFRPFTEAPVSWPNLAGFNRKLSEVLSKNLSLDENENLSPPTLVLSPDGKLAWVAFHDSIEAELRNGGELYDVRDVASKAADNVARLAALFHCFEKSSESPIGVESVEGAGRIVAWHLNEARRFFGEIALPKVLENAVGLEAWLIEYCRSKKTKTVLRRDVQRLGPNGIRVKKALDEALQYLADAGRVRLRNEGRTKEIVLNPALLDGGCK
jgi:putative DNA primase/helicase